jgi:hypothetical protein
MNMPVEFGLALSSSSPSGTGSYNYNGSFDIVVQNLAFQKQVSIWTEKGPGTWKNVDAVFAHPLDGNRELWTAPADDSEGQFVAKYTVGGATYWDNNNWANYRFPQAFDEFAALAGRDFPIVLGSAGMGGSNFNVEVGVQDLDYAKVVGVVFTTDNWATAQTAYCAYVWTMKSGLQIWSVTVPIGGATEVKFALFYRVLGTEYWDNNFSRNYTITPATTAKWGGLP